ncbi:conserved oligomeric Golgi complex subunit 5 [Sabethes cyaneus]|uniref:conserved oligomeric Golgi complex subunit 5 n=1 Tax=Sabethes cyaneus TaxID=53552 RepID=UPI00237D4787|nr:conserved oligomeric Golgi complex subunit 5 [Sabethes cyaneus]
MSNNSTEKEESSTFDCKDIESNEFFRAFLTDQPEARADLAVTMTIAEQIARLSDGMEQISTRIQTQVRDQYGTLLSQANHAGHLNASIGSISEQIEALRDGADRLKKLINGPYEQLETQTKILGRLHETSHLLRQSSRFLQIYKGLEKAAKLPDQASIVYELECLMEDVELGKLDFLKEEIANVAVVKARLLQVANRDLFDSIENAKEDETKECLLICLNMKTLDKCLNNILETYQRYINDSIRECYTASDVAKSGKTSSASGSSKDKMERSQPKGPGKAPALTSSANFRSKLWQALEWLFLDEFNSYCQQISFLQRCLLELPITEEFTGAAKTISKQFWDQLQNQLIDSFASAQPHVQQALQQGLPKLLSVARGLERNMDNAFVFDENVFVSLEAGYLEKCANNLKAVLIDIDFPNQEVIDSLVRAASNELNAAIVDDRLTTLVTGVICVSSKDLWNRIERNVKLGGDTQQVLDNPNAAQSQNITLANVVHYHHQAVTRLIQILGAKFSSSESAVKLRQSLSEGRTITLAIIQQLIASIHSAVNIILLSMHREPGLNTTTISTAGPSFYMKELHDFLHRSWNCHIVPFADKSIVEECGQNLAVRCVELFVQNAAIVRPISHAGRQRLRSDSHHLEVALKPVVPDLTVLGKSLRLLRAMSSLLVVSAEELVKQTSERGGSVPAYIVLFMLFGYAGPELASPHITAGWSNEKLIQWLESHSSDSDRLELITGALQRYRAVVRQKNITQYDVVYPLLTSYLEGAIKGFNGEETG